MTDGSNAQPVGCASDQANGPTCCAWLIFIIKDDEFKYLSIYDLHVIVTNLIWAKTRFTT